MELKLRSKAAFGFGAFGKDIAYMLINSYILYYYNVVLGLSGTFIGTILMVARIFDAVNDPFMGILVAKTKTRWGKFRPWIFSGTALNAVVIYALFAVPDSVAANAGNMKVWMAVFYLIWGVTYTLMDIPFWSMIPAITNPGKDREQLSSLARSCSGVGDALPTVLTMVIVPILSGSAVIADYKIGFKWWALIVAIVFLVSEIVFCLNVPEKTNEEMEVSGIKQMFVSLFKNDQAMVVVASVILVYTAFNIISNLVLYFFQFDLNNTGAYSTFVAICFATQVVIMMTVPLMRRRVDKMKLFSIGLGIQVIGFILLLGIAYLNLYSTTWLVLAVPGILVFAGYGILNVMLTVFLSDSVDYGELKNGTREESVIFSMQTFTVKLASGIGVFVAGLATDVIGLKTGAEGEFIEQTAATLRGLKIFMTVPSAVIIILAFIVFKKFYKLNDKKMVEITEKLNKK